MMASARFARGVGAALFALVIACGGASGDKVSAAQEVTVAIAPDGETLYPGDRETFTASVMGTADQSVTWAVVEGDAGGAVSGDGTYTAPATEGVYHLVATSRVSPTSKATSSVSVSSWARRRVTVAVDPATATVAAGGSQAFSCSVSGSSDTACTWSVREGAAGGAVTSAGVYTAPQAAGTYHVVATSEADATRTATATVTVTASQAQAVAVTIAPRTASVSAGGSQAFSCSVTGSTDAACTWSVQEGASGGAVTSAGVYTAPQAAGTYHVVAKSQADVTKSDTATVTVTAPPPSVAVTIAPTTASLTAGGSRSFTCSVTGSTDTACTWSVQEGASGGSVTSAGVYTAPQAAGTYHVVAKSHADATKSGTAAVTVTAPSPVVAVTIAPTTASLTAGGSRTFTCSATGSSDTACTWSVQEGASGGSVTSEGVYTAPQTAGTYHVVAKSHADATRSATAAVTVTAPTPSVAISLTPTMTAVDACDTLTFAATVTGSSNTAVAWSVSEGSAGGTVSSSGVYTAPATGGTYHVVATSNADPTKSQTATVTVTERIVSVEVTPGSTTVTAGGTVQFTATVTTTCGSFTQSGEATN
jgi:uncharacterized protein YjdB